MAQDRPDPGPVNVSRFSSILPEGMQSGRATLQPAHLAHRGVALLERLPRNLAVLALGEEMGIDRQGDIGVRMAELATHEYDVQPLAMSRLA